MPTREELHKLIDSMPEGAMEAAHRMLSHLQVWPPPGPPQRVEKRIQVMHAPTPGTIAGFAGGGNYDPAKGLAYSSHSHWENDWHVHEVLRPPLKIVERTRVDGQRLIYRHEVQGPGDKRNAREVVFDLA
jgi:hypothetical protein